MNYLVGIICFLIFLYSLYILVKDDYVLIRKNLSLDQIFDFAIGGIIIGFIIAKILTVIFNLQIDKNIFIQFYSFNKFDLSLTSFVFGCLISFYLIGKRRKFPIGRLFDFLTLAFISSLPVGYLISVFIVNKNEIIYYFALGIIYIVLHFIFWRYIYLKMVSAKIKEGTICSLFFLVFSVVTFTADLVNNIILTSLKFDSDYILLACIFIVSLYYLLINERRRILRKKTVGI